MAENHFSGIEQESMRLSAHDSFGKPVVHRSFAQISQQARQLRENIGLVTTHKERAAASELLTGAVDTLALTNELGHFQVQPQLHEDLDDSSACQSVPEYIEKLRQRNIQKTIETNIRDSGERFDNFMQRRMDSLWASMRHSLLSTSMAVTPSTALTPTGPADRPTPPGLLPTPSATNFSPVYPSPTGKATFTPAQQELSKVVCEYQRAVHAGSVYNILDEIKPVLDHIAAENTSSGPVGVADLLAILKAQHAAVRNARSNAPGGAASLQSQRAALTGSLGYMEGAYLKLMEQRVRSNRQTAMAGGTGSLSALIQGFIMASSRQPGSGGAVLVPPSRQSVAWQQVYHALRCNAVDAALEAAAPQALAFPGGHHISGELQGWLNAWHAGGRVLPASTASEIERQAVGVVESRELEKQGVPLARAVVLTLCVLSGSIKPLNAATASDARSGVQPLLPGSGVASIEDWMWLRCSVARSQHSDGLGEDSALRQLQADVCAASPAHYTRDGARPLHYAVVLLLSLQFRRALSFLHVNPMCRALRVTAPTLALAVHDCGLSTLGGAGDLTAPVTGQAGLVNRLPASVLRQYARESYGLVTQAGWSRDSEAYLMMLRVAVDMQLACEPSAATGGGDADSDPAELLRDVLREWALQTRDVGTELDQEKLRLFEANGERRRRVLRAVAEDLRWDEPDMAGLLFALCGHHSKALEEVCGTLATRIRALAAAASSDQERACVSDIQALGLRAQELKSSFGDWQLTGARDMSKAEADSQEDVVARHWAGFLDLQRIARIVEAHRSLQGASTAPGGVGARVQVVLREAAALQWLPVASEDVPRCVRRVQVLLQQYHRDLLPLTLVAVAQALSADAATKTDVHLAHEAAEKRAHIVQFAHLLNAEHGVDFVPQSVVRQLTEAP